MTELKGWHVLSMFLLGFGIIISVNLTLAFNAVRTFPGLEVKNSYVASQSFNADRAAQIALEWDVTATLRGHDLSLTFVGENGAVQPTIDRAIFGRATSVAADQEPVFVFDGARFTALVDGGAGNWNLRLWATAPDGTQFQQRVIVEVLE